MLPCASCPALRLHPEKKKPEPVVKIVETRIVELDDVPAEIVAYGRLASSQPVILYSEVDGTLQRGDLNFRPGQSFKKGNLLLKIDTRQITLEINTAKSDLLTCTCLSATGNQT